MPPALPNSATLELAHDPQYVAAFLAGRLDAAQLRRIGFGRVTSTQTLIDRTLAEVAGGALAFCPCKREPRSRQRRESLGSFGSPAKGAVGEPQAPLPYRAAEGVGAPPCPTPPPPAGTLLTAELALAHGLACNTAGGTHHAFRAGGSGFCILNDLAVTAEALLAAGRVQRVLILDLDVHQVGAGCRV